MISDDTGIVKERVRIQTRLLTLKTHVYSLRMLSITRARKWERCWWPACAFLVYSRLCKFSLVLAGRGESGQELGDRPTRSVAPFTVLVFVENFCKEHLDSEWGFLSWSLYENHSLSRARLSNIIIMIFFLQTRSLGHCARPARHRGPRGTDMTWSSWIDFFKEAACRSSVSHLAFLELACLFEVRRAFGPLERNPFRTLNSSLITSNTHSSFFV